MEENVKRFKDDIESTLISLPANSKKSALDPKVSSKNASTNCLLDTIQMGVLVEGTLSKVTKFSQKGLEYLNQNFEPDPSWHQKLYQFRL